MRGKSTTELFSRYFGKSSRLSSVDLMKIRKVVTIGCKTVTVRHIIKVLGI